ncbi:hypothetical protein [Glycomyces xiaoerkulensis]|uniref:hypothetical protein n=1 Tax=Glycomyces xiaoerkulensis TaxID=2038139 RepID=UPI000C264DE1|nr:hypothetical protein [Glycomyces xiaoerkulensis]
MGTPDPDDIWRLLNEARFEEASEAKVAAMERAVEDADSLGDAELVNYALNGLVDAYECSRDSTRILAPFARLLRNFDTRPEHFDDYLTRSLYWTFKWIVEKMIHQPDVPLESVEHWLEEMRSRYAAAGYSMHAVHAYEMELAFHIGDYGRVAAAIEALGAAEEDDMSDCPACQYTSLATIVLHAESDSADACLQMLDPVLDGEHTCAREPHYALALSLIPLVELGRTDQARANHLRGYVMCKGKEDMVRMIALHAEFCALTGNEARAAEILADHAHFLDLDLAALDRQRLLEATVLTCRRLAALGFPETAVLGPGGQERTAAELHDWADAERRAVVARFDARNGNDHHSRTSETLVAATPYDQAVHLGLKELRPRGPDSLIAAEPVESLDLDKAIDAAYDAFDDCSVDTWKAWLRVGAIADRLGIELIAEHRAEIAHAESAESDDPEAVLDGLARASELFGVAGQPGRALVADAFALMHRAEAEPERTGEGAAAVVAAGDRLRAERRIDDRSFHTSRVLAMRAEYIAAAGDPARVAPDLEPRARDLEAELARLPEARWTLIRRCDLTDLRARVTADPGARIALLRSCLDLGRAAEADWAVARANADLADQFALAGDFGTAMRFSQDGIAAVGLSTGRSIAGKLHLQAAEFSMRLGDHPATYEHGLRASVHCDAAGMVIPAAIARHLMGVALVEQDRRAEAVPILEAALTDLPEGELWRVCNVRFNLAESYDELDETRHGVEHGLAALALMEAAEDEYTARLYADTLFLTGELLEKLGEHDHALEIYTRAAEAAERLGELASWTRVSRARVWLLRAVSGDDAFAEGLQAMAQLAARLQAVRADPAAPEPLQETCRFELGETYRQHAQLTFQFLESQAGEPGLRREEAEPVLDLQRRALSVFRDGTLLLERASLTAHQTMWLLGELGDVPGAIAVGEDALSWLAAPEFAEAREGFEQHLDDLRRGGQ